MIDYPAEITEKKNGTKKSWKAFDADDVISHVSAYVESGDCPHLQACERIRVNGSGAGFRGDPAAELAAWVEEWSEFESDVFSDFGSSPTEIAANIIEKHGCDVVVTRDEYGWSVSDVQNAESEDEFWLRAYGESKGLAIDVRGDTFQKDNRMIDMNNWITFGADQGQMVKVSYMYDAATDRIVRRRIDRSTGTETQDSAPCPDDCEWSGAEAQAPFGELDWEWIPIRKF